MLRPALLALALLAQPGAPALAQSPSARARADSAPPHHAVIDSAAARDSTDRRRSRPATRRQAVTAEHERTAFADAQARTLLAGARAARLSQDSALRAYDAKTFQRLSVGVGVRRFGPDRLLFRTESAAHVQWSRAQGVWIQPTGRRHTSSMFSVHGDFSEMAPIPYFPGRETLWFPSGDMGVARAEVDEKEMLHPLATGAEAYYRYATGDSVQIRLPDGKAIRLRELRITARRPEWRAFVGSFWFDVERGALVRAAYRMAADMDIWEVANEDEREPLDAAIARARSDTSRAAREAVAAARRAYEDDKVPGWVAGSLNPMRARLSSITVEYGLYEGRFWLPKVNVAEGEAEVGFVRMPIRFEESFRYASVNGDAPAPPIPAPEPGDTVDAEAGGSMSLSVGSASAHGRSLDSLAQHHAQRADSLRHAADSLRARGDTAAARRTLARARRSDARATALRRQRAECARDSTYFAGTRTRFDGALRVAVRMPCDTSSLSRSPDLPPSANASGEAMFGAQQRDELLAALDMSLQPDWAPQPPVLRTGLDLVRFNRVEGVSVGGTATSTLGLGYTAQALARIGTNDLVPNGELSLSRSNGRQTLRGAVFHRLAAANDDWGNPLSFGASLAGALYGRDEGFYYRAWGAELTGTRERTLGGTALTWRLFGERQRGARAELRKGLFGPRFVANIAGDHATSLGAGADVARAFGVDPRRARLATRARVEGAWVDFADRAAGDSAGTAGASPYGRGMLEATLTRPLGPLAASLTGAVGAAVGDRVPDQRLFYVGGLQTVRGQFAHPVGAGYAGNAFWLARSEVGLDALAVRPAVFLDLGWAGARGDFAHPGRPLSGAGVGVSFLDGLLRADLSRGISPEKRWRLDLSVDARF